MLYHKKFYRQALSLRRVHSVPQSAIGLHSYPGWKNRDDFVDKNWSPLRFQGRLLWSYYSFFHPHVVCEMDIDITAGDISTPIDCLLCAKQFSSSSSAKVADKVEATLLRSMQPHMHERVHLHLNGVSCFKLRRLPFYIGVIHSISHQDVASRPAHNSNRAFTLTRKEFHHFFFYNLMHDYPPFAVGSK